MLVHYSMIKLPEDPMKPRLFDERVGYFTLPQTDYGQTWVIGTAAQLHHAVATGEKRPYRSRFGAREADRILCRPCNPEGRIT